jgi:hypothetical protein
MGVLANGNCGLGDGLQRFASLAMKGVAGPSRVDAGTTRGVANVCILHAMACDLLPEGVMTRVTQ